MPAEHDPESFRQLFAAEPEAPSATEVAEWVGLYSRLIELLERQLMETQRFAEAVPGALRDYLGSENMKILAEELEIFRGRLMHWRGLAAG